MHILFATPGFIDNKGPTSGFPKYLLRTAKILVEWGHEVTIVTCSNRTIVYEFMGINIRRVRCPSLMQYRSQTKDEIATNLSKARLIASEIDKVNKNKYIDIIQYTNLGGVSYFHNFKIPAILRLSSYARMLPVRGYEEGMEIRAEIERKASIKCDAIFAPSKIVARAFAEDIQRNVDVIETPFVLETDEIDENIYREFFEGKQYILFYGTLIEYKGLKVIADSIYRILSSHKDIYFGIIGDGDRSLVDMIRENAGEHSERIIYHSAIGFSELIPIIKNAQLVTLPSLMENFSNACVESMALGQIVLGTNGASYEQLIEDGENGLLCEIGSPQAFADKIDEALNFPEQKKKQMREKAVMRTDSLRPETVTKQLVDYYIMVIENYRKCK